MRPSPRKIALCGVVLVLLATVWWQVHDDLTDVAAKDIPVTGTTGEMPEGALLNKAESSKTGKREAIVAPPGEVAKSNDEAAAKTTGSLLVRVIYGDDSSPAKDVVMSLREVTRTGPRAHYRRLRTDVKGEVRFDDLRGGKVVLISNRDHLRPKLSIVVAGTESVFVFELKGGIVLKGVVVDKDGVPVAGADIQLSEWAGIETRTVAQSDPQGRFHLRQVGKLVNISARAKGYAPSPLRTVMAGSGAEVDVRITLPGVGGSLHGRVVDPDGRGVANASVKRGKLRRDRLGITLPDGSRGMNARAARTQTDAEGRFELHGLLPGEMPILVRADSFIPYSDSVVVEAGVSTRITIPLVPGVTCFGVVKSDKGEPVSAVEITHGEYDAPDRRATRSETDGSYRLQGLPAGEIEVQAKTDDRGNQKKTLHGVAGQRIRVDFTLSRGLVLQGVVTGEGGKPLERAWIMATGPFSGGRSTWMSHARADKEGRFELIDCPIDGKIGIEVQMQNYAPIKRFDVDPTVGRIEIRMKFEGAPTAKIIGTVLDPDGKPVVDAQVSAVGNGEGTGIRPTSKEGRIELSHLRAGEYTLSVQSSNLPRWQSEKHRLEAGGIWDIGTIRLVRGGTVRVTVDPPDTKRISIQVIKPDGTFVARFNQRRLPIRSDPVAPGSYLVRVKGRTVRAKSIPITIRAGKETEARVEILPATPGVFVFLLPPGDEDVRRVTFTLTSSAGEVFKESTGYVTNGDFKRTLGLAPGRYSLRAQTATGSAGSAEFEVPAGSTAEKRIRVQLR